MADSVAQQYVDAGKELLAYRGKIEKARRDIERAEGVLREIGDDYEKAHERLAAIIENYGDDPLNLLGGSTVKQTALKVAGEGDGRVGRGKNQEAIMEALQESSEGLSQSDLNSKVMAALGSGSPASLNQATAKLYKDGKIKRTGRRGSFLYWHPDNEKAPAA